MSGNASLKNQAQLRAQPCAQPCAQLCAHPAPSLTAKSPSPVKHKKEPLPAKLANNKARAEPRAEPQTKVCLEPARTEPRAEPRAEPQTKVCLEPARDITEDIPKKQILGEGNEAVVYSPPKPRKEKFREMRSRVHLPRKKASRDGEEREEPPSEKPAPAVAIKRCRYEENFPGLKKEFDILSRLEHPHIMRVYKLDVEKMEYSMERCDPLDLFDVIEQLGGLSDRTSHRLSKQLLSAVAYLHREGIVHSDIKLENVLVRLSPKHQGAPLERRVRSKLTSITMCDFGFATAATEGPVGRVFGSPGYVDPAAIKPYCGHFYTKASDVFATGITIYGLRTGNFPWRSPPDSDLLPTPANGRRSPGGRHALADPANPLCAVRLAYIKRKRELERELIFASLREKPSDTIVDTQDDGWVGTQLHAQLGAQPGTQSPHIHLDQIDIDELKTKLADSIANGRTGSVGFFYFIASMIFPSHSVRYTAEEALEKMWVPYQSPPTRRLQNS